MRRRGFTMTELLVTVATVSLLVSLLVPGLRAAAAVARTTACTSNLRHLAVACASYETTNAALPAAILYFRQDGDVRTVAWDFEQRSGQWSPGPLWSHVDGAIAVHQCPDFEGDSTFGADPFTGYNYNTSYLGHEGSYPTVDEAGNVLDGWATARRGLPTGAIRSPASTALFGDGGWRGGANKFMRAPAADECDPATACAGTQAFRHWGGCSCVAHLDGHVGTCAQPRRGERSTPQLARWVTDHPSNGFLSEDDSAYGGD